jgi:hypothetical protein
MMDNRAKNRGNQEAKTVGEGGEEVPSSIVDSFRVLFFVIFQARVSD